jgi:PAS domain S-box-containing protein
MESKRIFIVEDEGIIANRLKSTLEMMGYIVCGATATGESAIEMVLNLKPDLVLMDIHLAGKLNGIEAAAQIHASIDVPIIYSTAYSDNFFLEKAKTTEPYSFLVKPVQDRELYAAIEMAFYRYEIDKQLTESEERYRIVSEIISDFAFSISLDGNSQYKLDWITPVFTELTGFTTEEISGVNSWKKLVPPSDYEIVDDIFEHILDGKEIEKEFRIMKRNREIIWINLHVKPIWNESKTNILKVYGAAQDITQRKYTENELLRLNNELELRVAERTTQLETAVEGLKVEIKSRLIAEEKLSESELRYRTLISNLPEYVIVHMNGKIVYFNDEVLRTSGYTAHEIYNNSLFMFVDPADREKIVKLMKNRKNGGEIPESEVNIKMKNGEKRINIIRTSKITFDKHEAFLTILLDITQLRETQKQIATSEMKYRSILETATDGFCILDPDTNILEVNDSMVKMTKYSREELLRMKTCDLEIGLLPDESAKRRKTLLEAGQTKFESKYRLKDNSIIEAEVSVKYLNIDGPKLYCFAHNITERQNTLNALRISEDKFSKAFLTSPDAVAINRLSDGKYLEINNGFTAHTGYTYEDIQGKTPLDINLWVDHEDRAKLFNLLKDNDSISNFESRFKDKSGKIGYGLMSIAKIEINGEKCMMSFVRDITERKEAEEQLKLQAKLIESAKDSIFLYNMEGEVVYANEISCIAHGYSHEEILKLRLTDLDVDLNPTMEKEIFNKLTEIGFITLETRHKRKDKSIFPVDVSAQLITRESGNFILSVERDITERVQASEALKESEDRYRNIIEYIPDAIAVHVNGIVVFANPAALKLIGAKTPEELLGKSAMDIVHPDYHNIARRRIQNSLLTNIPQPIEHEKLIKLDGTVIDVEVTSVPINYGNSRGLQIILRDITDKREAELQLRKLSRAVEQSPAGIVITDVKGNIQYVNPKFTEITGYSFNEVLNQNPRILKSGEHDDSFYKALWSTILEGNEWRGEIRNKKKTGELYWEFSSISGIKNEKGEVTHFLAVKEDYTDRKNLEAELIRSKVDAEEANNLKSSLLANMSHELRTPLNGILGFAQLLRDELAEPDQVNMLGKITRSGKRLMNTLNSVLMLTELENNNYLITKNEVDLGFFCHQIKTLYNNLALEKKLNLIVDIKTDNCIIETDENLLTKIISNLVENAIKYTTQGSITLELSELTRKNSQQRFAMINVIDTGIGIKRENQDIIFREFKQLSEGFRRDFEGLGLGLSLSKKMANLIGAEILVESAIGVGSIFTLTIPLEEQPSIPIVYKKEFETPIKQTEESISNSNEFKKILLVEDNPLNIEVVQRFLSKNYEVNSARDGDSAIEMFTQNEYALFMIDINLGQGIDGIQVLKEIRKIDKYNHAPVIALTGYASDSNRRDFLQQGFTHYLAKPFEKKELLKIINGIFNKI